LNFFAKILSSKSKEDKELTISLAKILGYNPVNLDVYKEAFTHSSLHKKTISGKYISYERLEFLGDAILGAIIAAYLYEELPFAYEGELTKMRSKIVSRENLNAIGKTLNLIDFVQSNIPASKFGDNIYGNVFEAFIGAIYDDKGYQACEKFIYEKIIKPYVDLEQLAGKITSYKSLLIEWFQKNKVYYHYESFEDTGKNEKIHFSVKLHINDKVIAKGRETSKKRAEEIASKRAYFALQDQIQIHKKV
jgi:ribonuclease-3